MYKIWTFECCAFCDKSAHMFQFSWRTHMLYFCNKSAGMFWFLRQKYAYVVTFATKMRMLQFLRQKCINTVICEQEQLCFCELWFSNSLICSPPCPLDQLFLAFIPCILSLIKPKLTSKNPQFLRPSICPCVLSCIFDALFRDTPLAHTWHTWHTWRM